MTTVTSKVRLYDLAKDLKLDTKRLIEEVRREGVDVSVPSNSISKELAEKIRNKYFPKKEPTVKRAVKVLKRQTPVAAEEEAAEFEPQVTEELPDEQAGATTVPHLPQEAATPDAAKTARPMDGPRVVKKLTPALRAEHPSAATSAPQTALEMPEAESSSTSTTQPQAVEAERATPASEEAIQAAEQSAVPQEAATPTTITTTTAAAPEPQTAPAPFVPSRQVKVLRPTSEAIKSGVIGPGGRAPVPVAPTPSPRERFERQERVRGGGGATETRATEQQRPARAAYPRVAPGGTPGETATPQTVYTPPPSDRKKGRSRGGNVRGGHKHDDRGRFDDRDFIRPPKALSLEDRIAGRLDAAGTAASNELKPVRIVEGSTVKEFAEKLGIKPKDIVTLLLQRGVFATINQALNDDVAADLGKRFGYEVTFVPFEEMIAEEEFEELIAADADDVELPRAPVVTVMGHVDHGKTSLLDGIRTTDVAAGEAGGITQHIGAYSVQVPNPDKPTETRRVVFLDTPGHEAFTMMRARGAKATDVVVLVVAADDGVMPQTVEAIEHSRAAGVPIIVAINKIDRPDANPDRVKQELATQGLQPIEWGGETEMVQVSAKKRENLDTLLETILLTTDILDLKASPTRLASGVVLEAKLDRGRGAVATVLVQQGTLRVGDPFIVGQIFGKVRAMFDDRGQAIAEAGPATPVEVLGLQGVPQAGESFQVVADITRAQQISHHRQVLTRQNTLLQTTKRGIEALGQTEIKELLVVIKADVQGSVEVLKSTLQKLSTAQVKVKVIRSGVGAITESDVLLASATQAGASQTAVVIIGFNVRPEVRAAELAKQESVDVRLHSIIYKVEEEIRAAMIGMLEAVEKERILGKAEVREVFRVPKAGVIAGCMVIDGLIRRNARARLIRDSVVAWEGGISSLRRFKDDASEVRDGFECGIGLENFNDIKVGDQIEAYIVEKVAATEL
ncbi:MAG: translation initiation factor [Blastocatellia bacterium]|jgi:translation initiation factor IF-2|nr:translation initiation factor [Blastocatellia bacterium]